MPDTYLVDITSEEENQFLAGLSLEKFWSAGKQSKQVEKKNAVQSIIPVLFIRIRNMRLWIRIRMRNCT
jgi:hypothetical protein